MSIYIYNDTNIYVYMYTCVTNSYPHTYVDMSLRHIYGIHMFSFTHEIPSVSLSQRSWCTCVWVCGCVGVRVCMLQSFYFGSSLASDGEKEPHHRALASLTHRFFLWIFFLFLSTFFSAYKKKATSSRTCFARRFSRVLCVCVCVCVCVRVRVCVRCACICVRM